MKLQGKTCVNCQKDFSETFVYCPNCATRLDVRVEISEQPKDWNYAVTLFEGRHSRMSGLLMLGASFVVIVVAISSLVSSIYYSDAFVAAIEDDLIQTTFLGSNAPPIIEEINFPKLNKNDDGSGGGSGGRHDKMEISKGELPPQFRDKPLLTPSKDDISVTNPEIAVTRATKGPNDIVPPKRNSTNGDPNSTNPIPSNGVSADDLGMGKDGSGGIGNRGRDGVGENGIGGIGRSTNDKYGDKAGTGIGSSKEDDEIDKPPTLKSKPNSGVSTGLNIILKPRPIYTDAARENGIQGTVTLRVTFNANGTIGSIVAISGLPHGLTEQAIAAAKNIKFEPRKRNGVAQTTSKQIAYSFILY